jgi:hypothetical protein
MGLRGKVRALERMARGQVESFELEDGSRHYYDPSSAERFLHSLECLRAQGEGKTSFPEPPETVWALLRAKDRAAALAQLYGSGAFDIFPYDKEAIVERAELVPLYGGRQGTRGGTIRPLRAGQRAARGCN